MEKQLLLSQLEIITKKNSRELSIPDYRTSGVSHRTLRTQENWNLQTKIFRASLYIRKLDNFSLASELDYVKSYGC